MIGLMEKRVIKPGEEKFGLEQPDRWSQGIVDFLLMTLSETLEKLKEVSYYM